MKMHLQLVVGLVALATIGGIIGCDGTNTSSDAIDPVSASSSVGSSGVLATADSASASSTDGPSERLAACSSAGAGDVCSFESPRGDTISGTCQARPDGSGELGCRPDEWPGEGRFGGQEEALAACSNVEVGAPCSFDGFDGNTVTGTCTTPPNDESVVVCRPDNWPGDGERPGRGRRPPEAALNACSGSSSGAACSFEARFGSVSGTCEMPPNGDALACRPSDSPPR